MGLQRLRKRLGLTADGSVTEQETLEVTGPEGPQTVTVRVHADGMDVNVPTGSFKLTRTRTWTAEGVRVRLTRLDGDSSDGSATAITGAEATAITAAPDEMCTSCGNKFREGAKFCGHCGTARSGGTTAQPGPAS